MRRTLAKITALLVGLLTVATSVSATPIMADEVGSPNGATFTESKAYRETKITYTLGSEQTLATVNEGTEFGIRHSGNAVLENGSLRSNGASPVTLYARRVLGDIYAATEGTLAATADCGGGTVTFGLRLLYPDDDVKKSGLYISFSEDGAVRVTENSSKCELTLPGTTALSGQHSYRITDSEERITVAVDDRTVLSVTYSYPAKSFTVFDGNGTLCGTFTSELLPSCGYWSITTDGKSGRIGDVSYTHSELEMPKKQTEYKTDYSTWSATDDLLRTTPVNLCRDDEKFVGVFYFVNHSQDNDSRLPITDVTALYTAGGFKKAHKELTMAAGKHGTYWAEPYFGYYSGDDVWVYRKHANMLSAAGADFIYVDLSNGLYFEEQLLLLFDTWLEMRREGQTTPQIALMFGDMPHVVLNGLYTLLDPIYNNEAYQELLFLWEGKPLILGNPARVDSERYIVCPYSPFSPETFEQWLTDHPKVKRFYNSDYETVKQRFTFRQSFADDSSEEITGYWDYMQGKQYLGSNIRGDFEQVTVSMGYLANLSRGRSSVGRSDTYNPRGAFGFELDTTPKGLFFEEQFNFAMQNRDRVQVMMITGWNEWWGGVYENSRDTVTGQTPTPGYFTIDLLSPEYSRDGEPMKLRDGVGFGDNYYYQMASYIRQFKGTAPLPPTVNGGTVDLAAKDIDLLWEGINPVFTDGVNDIQLRSAYSWKGRYLYTNHTARNDIAYAKISQDISHVYFYVKTANDMILADTEDFMNLFVDTDNDPKTGWEGYDIVINRSRGTATASVERFTNGQWAFEKLGDCDMVMGQNSITLKVPRSMLGPGEAAASFRFKWADHSVTDGDVMKFMELGDAAPDDRFRFEYRATSTADERKEPETTSEPAPVTTADPTDITPPPAPPEETTAADTADPVVSEPPALTNEPPASTGEPTSGCRSALLGVSGLSALTLGISAIILRKKKGEKKR